MAAAINLVMTECEIQRKVSFRLSWTHGLRLVEQTLAASQAFEQLYQELCEASAQRLSVAIRVQGALGLDVDREFSVGALPQPFLRALFRAWYTQAVQAQAAIFRQPVVLPAKMG